MLIPWKVPVFLGGAPMFFFLVPHADGHLDLEERARQLEVGPANRSLVPLADFSVGFSDFPWQHHWIFFGGLVEPILNFETFQVVGLVPCFFFKQII